MLGFNWPVDLYIFPDIFLGWKIPFWPVGFLRKILRMGFRIFPENFGWGELGIFPDKFPDNFTEHLLKYSDGVEERGNSP